MRKIYFIFCTGFFLAACMPQEALILSPSHLVAEKGDTVYSIAQEHQVPVRELIRVNRLKPPYNIQEGQILTLPYVPTPETVDAEETVYKEPAEPSVPQPAFAEEKKEGPCLLDADLTQPQTANFEPSASAAAPIPQTASAVETYTCAPEPQSSPKTSKNNRLIEESSVVFEKGPEKRTMPSKTISREKAVPEPAPVSVQKEGVFSMPSKGSVVLKYGETLADGKKSRGILIRATGKKMVSASADGEVLFVGHELNGKNVVIIKHPGGWMSAYLPLRTVCVKAHQPVKAGQKIGFLQGDELHFEIRKNRVHVNPMAHISS